MLSWSLVNRRSGKLLFCFDIIFTYKTVEFFKASITSYLRWPNTVFARSFADVIERAHKDCKNKNVVNRAIPILYIQNPHFLRYFFLLLMSIRSGQMMKKIYQLDFFLNKEKLFSMPCF